MLKFLGIGAQKCGTTWLYEQLRRHPDLRFPAGKEIHFWDMHYGRGVGWYKSLFKNPDSIEGEITPAYAILPREKIREVYENFPELRLIYITRDPIERAWSAALMEMKRAGMVYEKTGDEWFINQFKSQGSLLRGNYKQCVENWLSFYRRDQLLPLSYNDIADRPNELLESCVRHIGVTADVLFDESMLSKRFLAGPGLPIRPSLLGALTELYGNIPQFTMQ